MTSPFGGFLGRSTAKSTTPITTTNKRIATTMRTSFSVVVLACSSQSIGASVPPAG